ncbi:MAG: hypothetical protein CMM59_20455 [Rhodospirillaceae bacterium]|nr:hypothetical protein [Rhodospirillaceae bacterium]
MKEANRANIEFVFADDNSQFRVGLRNALMHEGYKDISDCSSLMEVEECFQTGAPDLLLIDVQMEGGAGFDTISKIRRSEIGKNPFIRSWSRYGNRMAIWFAKLLRAVSTIFSLSRFRRAS